MTTSNIVNKRPHTDPESGPSTSNQDETCYWMKDQTGTVQIDDAIGIVFPTGNTPTGVTKTVQINLTGTGIKPQWLMKETGLTDRYYGGNLFRTIPPQVNFLLNDQIQVVRFDTPPNASGYSANVAVLITPRH